MGCASSWTRKENRLRTAHVPAVETLENMGVQPEGGQPGAQEAQPEGGAAPEDVVEADYEIVDENK